MAAEHVFVESYRKELAGTGYPFNHIEPLLTVSGYAIPVGTFVDASIYCTQAVSPPVLDTIVKNDSRLTISLSTGETAAADLLDADEEILEFYSTPGVFGGILVVDRLKFRGLGSWKNGTHKLQKSYMFCPRCLTIVPPLGVQRFRSDTDRIISGNMAFAGLRGTILQLLKTDQGQRYIEVNYVGDPAYAIADDDKNNMPINRILVTDNFDNQIVLLPDALGDTRLIAVNTDKSNLEFDALKFETKGTTIRVTLGGK
jgi:hypothetical protein